MFEDNHTKRAPEAADCEVFFEEKQKNYRASIDLIQKLLKYPERNSNKLDRVFVAIWEQEKSWKDHETYSLHFLHGCYLLMNGDVNGALLNWLKMDFQSENVMEFLFLDFSILPRIKYFYHWSNEFTFDKVLNEILMRLNGMDITISEKERLTVLQIKIENALKVDIPNDRENESETEKDFLQKTFSQISEKAKCLQGNLEKCETYFINWLGDYQMKNKELKSIAESPYGTVAHPYQQTEEKLKEDITIHSMLTIQNVVAPISPLVEAFFHILCGNMDLVAKNISWVEYVTKHCVEENILCEESADGIKYLCDLVKIHRNLKLGISNNVDGEHFISRFETLSGKGKSMVFVAKWILNESIPNRNTSIQDLKQVLSLDANNIAWNFALCNRLRFLRRREGYLAPEEDEIFSIARAVENSVSIPHYHAVCVSGLCQCLAEIIDHRFHQRFPNTPVNIGTKIFQSEEKVVEYIKETAKDAFKRKTFDFSEAIRYGEMFSSLLSFKHRDYELAERCYKFCLERSPTNSKANHRMGTLQLTGKGDMEQAIHFFKLALEFTPKNFPAWIDLIQTLLAFPRENSSEIEKFLKLFGENEKDWSENERFSAHFLEGCYLAMTEKIPKAVSLWTKHNFHTSGYEKCSDFHQLQRISKRYKWPQGAGLNYEALINEILIRMESASVPDKQRLKQLKVKIENEIYRQSCRYEYGSSAGTTAHRGRQHHHWQSRSTVSDKDSSWRTSNLPEAPLDHDNVDKVVRQPNASSTNTYVPPHLRARRNSNNTGQDKLPNRGFRR